MNQEFFKRHLAPVRIQANRKAKSFIWSLCFNVSPNIASNENNAEK